MKNSKKVFWSIYLFLFVNVICFASTFAYLDPTTTTILLQVIVGVVVAAGTVIVVLFRKAKKKVADKLGIDEKQNKEVEEEFVVLDEKKDDAKE